MKPRWLPRWLAKASESWIGGGFWPRLLGDRGERLAARHLRNLGYRIIARRYRTTMGELDLIALDGECVVFIEVKTRRTCDTGHPVEAVDRAKQAQLTRLALAYLKRYGRLEQPARFDVVAVIWSEGDVEPEIVHYRNAFEPPGRGQMYG